MRSTTTSSEEEPINDKPVGRKRNKALKYLLYLIIFKFLWMVYFDVTQKKEARDTAIVDTKKSGTHASKRNHNVSTPADPREAKVVGALESNASVGMHVLHHNASASTPANARQAKTNKATRHTAIADPKKYAGTRNASAPSSYRKGNATHGICQEVQFSVEIKSKARIICKQSRSNLGDIRMDTIGTNKRLVFTPATSHDVTLLLVLVGPAYAKSVITSSRFLQLLSWAALHNYGLVADTRSFCVLRKDLPAFEVGPYGDLCDETSERSRWYGDHGWRWAWTKPWAVLRFALDYQKKFEDGALGESKQAAPPPHYLYYVDGEAVPKGEDIRGFSLSPMSKRRRKIAKRNSESPKAYPWMFQTGEDSFGRGVGLLHSDQFLLDVTSHVVHRFLARWINHSDCEAWVEQGSYWIETLRTLEESASSPFQYAAEDNGQPCGRRYSPQARAEARAWLNSPECLEQNKDRRCTWSTPTEMACAATSFDKCFKDATWRLKNITINNQPPPILFVPSNLWPIRTKDEEKKKFNDTEHIELTRWLDSQLGTVGISMVSKKKKKKDKKGEKKKREEGGERRDERN